MAAEKAERYKGNVKFEHVRFAYKEGEDVLKDISFQAKQGQTVALVGHTGSGKSSILNLLFRFYDVRKAGSRWMAAMCARCRNSCCASIWASCCRIRSCSQGRLRPMSVLDDPSITRERVEAALREVGAAEMFRQPAARHR